MDKKDKRFSRRGFPGVGVLLPFLGMAKAPAVVQQDNPADEFTTMLTAKGTVVRVKRSALKDAKIVEKSMSNKSLLGWLKLKG